MHNRIKQLRKDLKMTQDNFARQIGLSRNFIAQVEAGTKNPSDRTISDICRIFDINEDWIRYGKEPKRKVFEGDEYTEAAARIDKNDPKARQAIIDYWKLSASDKELWWNFIDRFINKTGGD